MTAAHVRIVLAGEDAAHELLMRRLVDAVLPGDDDLTPDVRFVRRERPKMPSGRPQYRKQRIEGRPAGFATVFLETYEAARAGDASAEVVCVLADEDGDASRGAAMKAAMDDANGVPGGPRPVFGLCNPVAEAWIVALSGPSRADRVHLARSTIGFDPAAEPHRLSAKPATHERHAKRIANFLLDTAYRRVEDAPARTPHREVLEAALGAVDIDPARVVSLRECGLAPFYLRLRAACAR